MALESTENKHGYFDIGSCTINLKRNGWKIIYFIAKIIAQFLPFLGSNTDFSSDDRRAQVDPQRRASKDKSFSRCVQRKGLVRANESDTNKNGRICNEE